MSNPYDTATPEPVKTPSQQAQRARAYNLALAVALGPPAISPRRHEGALGLLALCQRSKKQPLSRAR